MTFKLPDLPYAHDALAPYVSAKTLQFHHGKHHRAYVDKLNQAIAGTGYAELPLEAIVASSHGTSHTQVYQNAAQAWNHAFLWQCMSPDGGGEPEVRLAELLQDSFGDLSNFLKSFKAAATGQFGSGWAWLVLEQDQLKVCATVNADTPLAMNQKPLLTLDVWEHAYYLDYQNSRDEYIDNFLRYLVNWKFVEERLAA